MCRSPGPTASLVRVHWSLCFSRNLKHLKLPTARPGALIARSHRRLEHCSLRSSLRSSNSLVYTVGQSAAWPGHCWSPRGCQMPGESAHIPLFYLWLSVKPSHLASRAESAHCQGKALLWPMPCTQRGGELGNCLQPGFRTHSWQALERSQCSSTAALPTFG